MHNSIHTVKMPQSGNAMEFFVTRLDRTEHFDVQVVVDWNKASRRAGCGLKLGVSCHAQYALALADNGRAVVTVIKVSGHQVTEHQTLTEAKLRPRELGDSSDTLTVKVRGQELAFFVNDSRMTQIIDTMMRDTWSLIVFAHGHQNVSFTSSPIRMQ